MLDSNDQATTIVVGVDGSPRSADAVIFAGRLAGATGAGITLVRAYPYVPLGAGIEDAVCAGELRPEAEASLERARVLIADVPDVTPLAVADPSPAHALHCVAMRQRAALVVIGSSHIGRVGRVVPGATGERLLHGAPCPVIIVPRGMRRHGDGPVAPIGAAYDGSPESRKALAAAVAAARALHAPLRVIAVAPVDTYRAPALQYGPGYYVDADAVRHRATEHLQAAMAEMPADVDAEPVVRVGAPARELIDASPELSMLFVGSRGYGPLRAVLLGGVSGALVRGASCPVLVTPRAADVNSATTAAAAAVAP